MKTNAPGKFSCEIYIKSWEIGFREGSTKLHIDHCPFCNPIVHGGTEEFPLSAADEAQRIIAEREAQAKAKAKQSSRRRFLRNSAVAASFVGLSALGIGFFQQSQTAPPTVNIVEAELASDYSRLDARFLSAGRVKIERTLSQSGPTMTIRTMTWIKDRQHTSLYDLVCRRLSDRNLQVAIGAYLTLREIPLVDLKPFIGDISIGERGCKVHQLKAKVRTLLTDIENS